MTSPTIGVLAMLAVCAIWGLSPLYYKLLTHVPPLEILAHRTLWSLVIFAGLLALQGRLGRLRAALSGRRAIGLTTLAALFISTNWFLFILSIQIGRTTEASLGYYIFPLVAVVFGVAAFGERLARAQWIAVALAGVAVLVLTIGLGTAPWISLVLAATFGIYGVIKKGLEVGPVTSVTAEVLLLAPLALGWLAALHGGWVEGGVFGQDLGTSALLVFSGLLTATPLILFARAAQLVNLSTVGLVQYLNPTFQFFCAVAIFGEPFTAVHAVAFGLIWTALALYSISRLRQDRARRRADIAAAASGATVTKSRSPASAKP